MNEASLNTDKEIWRKIPGDYYSPSIHVTEFGGIGINVGGYVLVAPVEKWHEAGIEYLTVLRAYKDGAKEHNIEGGWAKCAAFEECNLKEKVGCNGCLYFKMPRAS